jgi:hypothetical protein
MQKPDWTRTIVVGALLGIVASSCGTVLGAASGEFDEAAADRFARLALDCVHREYPNKIAHVMQSDEDVGPPRELTPAFYGCFDWHSAVHGHWLLVRLARLYPDAPFAAEAREALGRSFSAERIAGEARYLDGEDRGTFERPYGLAWLLQLVAELREWEDPDAQRWSETIGPLEQRAAESLRTWLPKLSHPIREGEHHQTAFAFGLILDWARVADDRGMIELLEERIRTLYLADRDCPLEYEPSAHDFLSPCLGQADLRRRVLRPAEYAAWLGAFLPGIPLEGSAAWLQPAVVTDRADGKLAHLDGLNLSRAWMLDGMLSGLPGDDPRRAAVQAAALSHRDSGLAAVTGEHYEGGHWLGSFAVYLVTERGLGDGQAIEPIEVPRIPPERPDP